MLDGSHFQSFCYIFSTTVPFRRPHSPDSRNQHTFNTLLRITVAESQRETRETTMNSQWRRSKNCAGCQDDRRIWTHRRRRRGSACTARPTCQQATAAVTESAALCHLLLLLLLQPFNGLFSRTTWVSRYQKGKTNLDFTEARDSEWQWHQLGHMQGCTSLQTDNHASTPPLSYLQAGCPSCHLTNSVKALKAQCYQ